jgi:hypothetical protein
MVYMLYNKVKQHAIMTTLKSPPPDRTVVKAVRIEGDLYKHASKRIRKEDLDFSKYVRRLIRADLAHAAN